MIKIRDQLHNLISTNPYLEYGLHHGLFNIAQVAEFIKPFIETRTKKTVSIKALEMALFRLKETERKQTGNAHPIFRVEKISVAKGLRIETFEKNQSAHNSLQKYYEFVAKKHGFCSITEGLEEITLVFEERYKQELAHIQRIRPKISLGNAGAIYVQFDVKYLKFPGMLHHILHVLVTQGINILEVASTSTSIVLYLAEEDLKLAFNTLHDQLFQSPSSKTGSDLI